MKISHRSLGCLLLTGLAWVVFAAQMEAAPKTLRAGAAASNITPWMGLSINGNMRDQKVEHIHDELHARCLVLDNGQTRLAIAVVDSCMVPRHIFDEAKGLIEQHTGIAKTHILLSATHTHSAPAATGVFQSEPDPEYERFLAMRIADGMRRAVNNLAPARIGWGVGGVADQVFNRRWKMKPGTIPPDPFGGTNDAVKMNPRAGDPNLVEPAGPTDPDISIVFVQRADGRPLALLANYSLHYCGGVGGKTVSADYFGVFADRIQELLGADRQDPPFVAMLSNGTSGDINNINFRGGQPNYPPYERMRTVAEAVAQETASVCRQMTFQDSIRLDARQEEISLGVRRPEPGEIERAREMMAAAPGREMRTLEEIYARETVLLADYPPRVDLILQALQVGDIGIAAIPCEVFVEIGLEIKAKSPFEPTFTMSLANGYNGYLPTVKHHRWGGYETWRARSSYLEVEAAPKITEVVLGLFGELHTAAQKAE